jgi:MYXO-CTERM domain-containing protein
VRLTGEHAGDSFGTVLDLGGDLDGDGSRDLVVGAPTFSYGRDLPEPPEDCSEWTAPPLRSGAVYVIHDAVEALADDGPVAVREHCTPGRVSDASIATAVIQASDPDEATFFGARVLATDLDGDGYDDLLATSLEVDTSGTVSFFPGPIGPGDLERDDAVGTLRSDDATSFTGWSLAASPEGSAIAVGSQDARLWIVREAPSGPVELGAPTASGDPGSGFATAIAWGPELLVGAPYADEVHVLDGVTFDPLGVLGGAPMLGWWVGWLPSSESELPDAVLTAPGATRNLTHQGVALILEWSPLLEGDDVKDETGCGCASAPASPFPLLLALIAIPGSRRRPRRRRAGATHRRAHRSRLRRRRALAPSPSRRPRTS